MSHPAARIGRISLVARDYVDVGVPDGLAGGFAAIGADVESVGAEARFEDRAQVPGEGEAGGVLDWVEVPDRRDMSARQDQRMAGSDGEGVEYRNCAGILRKNLPLRLTEDAALQSHLAFHLSTSVDALLAVAHQRHCDTATIRPRN